jgi:Holliday junction DNA helicase RuvA
MIAGLRGRLEGKSADSVLVDVGGVIYRVGTSATTLTEAGEIGDDLRLHTHLFVREDQLTLYGFATPDELRLFETMIGVTGIGPRLACAILSHIQTDLLYQAIQTENADFLATVPGVGRKTAARLILELRGKLPTLSPDLAIPVTREDAARDEVVAALRALGYTAAEAHTAALRGGRDLGADASVEDRVLAALRELGQSGS